MTVAEARQVVREVAEGGEVGLANRSDLPFTTILVAFAVILDASVSA